MKRVIHVLVIGLLFMLMMGCATGSSKYMAPSIAPEGPAPGKALVYFMRPSGYGSAIHFQIWQDYQLIGLSQGKSYFAYQCDPGKHVFIGRAENKQVLEADLEAGKSYYIITQVKMGAWKARTRFIPVVRGSKFWDAVMTYKQKLKFIARNQSMIDAWVTPRRGEINAELNQIISYSKTPEGQRYVVRIEASDGR